MALAMFPESANLAAIINVGLPKTDTSIISDGLAILQQLLLIDKEYERFKISLPLTRSYVFGELENNPEFAAEARERWINWYLEYSHKYGRKDEKEWNEYKHLAEEWENLQDVIEWCIEQDRYHEFLQLWRNINGYSHAQGYYKSDRTKTWQLRLEWINWLISTARQQKKWADLAELIFYKARTLTLMGNKLEEAKPLFVEVWKLSQRLDKLDQDIDFQLKIASHIVYLRWKELKVYQANLWLRLSEKLIHNANFSEETANRHQFYVFYFRGKISEYRQDYDRAVTYYNQSLNLAEALNWQRAISIVKNWLGDVKVKQGNLAAAKLILDECLQIAEENSDKCRAAFCKESLAFLEEKNGNLLATRELAKSAYEDFVSLGMVTEAAETQAFIERIK
jgi:LuxR family glucitol operon transcriptional activator